MSPPPKIAIIGAGASGLAASRIFSRNGLKPIIFEKEKAVGGVWEYKEGSKSHPMYRGLRTNLPKEIMAFREFPFPNPEGPSFLSHTKVQEYLELYEKHFDLNKYIQFGCEVTNLEVLQSNKSAVSPASENWPQIRLEWNDNSQTQTKKMDIFDVVCVCNGHYSKPMFAKITGLQEHFQGKVIHSIEYDNPADFTDQKVLCVGGKASGSDIAREISAFAKHVYLSDSSCPETETQGNITWVPTTLEVKEDVSVGFDQCPDVTPTVDCIIFCTGYDYHFPFIHNPEILESPPGERRVMPLYQQLWHARYPSLAFIGLPHSVVPFPEVELQAESVHAQFQDCKLPPLSQRMESAQKDATSGGFKESGCIQDTHFLGGYQWEYCRAMAKLAGILNKQVDNYITVNQRIYEHAWERRKDIFPSGPDTYRDINYTRDDDNCSFSFEVRSLS